MSDVQGLHNLKKIELSALWHFQIDIHNIGEKRQWYTSNYNHNKWRTVPVPQAWDCYEDSLWGFEGIGWYKTTLPQKNKGDDSLLTLQFGRVNYHAKIWLNGIFLGEHCNGYTPFDFDVSSLLSAEKESILVVRVDNKPKKEWLPGNDKTIEWILYGGILEPVFLLSTNKINISNLTITGQPDGANGKINCTLELTNKTRCDWSGEVLLEIESEGITEQLDVRIPADVSTLISKEILLPEAKYWSPENPHLYSVKALIQKDSHEIDCLVEQTGIRSLTVQGRDIILNGKILKLKGVNRYNDIGRCGFTQDKELIRKDLKLIKDAGINIIRTHYPQPAEFLSLLDETGLLLMEEIAINWWGVKNWDKSNEPTYGIMEHATESLKSMLKKGKNHPCVLAFSLANESATNTEIGIDVMKKLIAVVRKNDPDRLVTFVVAHETKEHLAFNDADLVCFNAYYGLSLQPDEVCLDKDDIDRLVRVPTEAFLKRQLSFFPNKPMIMTEFGAQSIYGLQGDEPYSEDFQGAYLQSVWNAIENTMGMTGGMVWCWADYYHRRGFTPHTVGPYGLVTTDRKVKKSYTILKECFK